MNVVNEALPMMKTKESMVNDVALRDSKQFKRSGFKQTKIQKIHLWKNIGVMRDPPENKSSN